MPQTFEGPFELYGARILEGWKSLEETKDLLALRLEAAGCHFQEAGRWCSRWIATFSFYAAGLCLQGKMLGRCWEDVGKMLKDPLQIAV